MCVGVCSDAVEQDGDRVCVCEGVLKTVANSNADLDMEQKIQGGRLLCRRKESGQKKNQKRQSRLFVMKSCKAQRNRCDEQV